MVIAEKWAEQRVLMRAYAECRDQTLPTIMLHGAELAIGPAGLDVHGPWGIHVGEPADGRAQVVKQGLEEAARRLAGSKGKPPRLLDESQTFDREPTGNWAPGTPRIVPQRVDHHVPVIEHVSPAPAARVPQSQIPTAVLRNTPAPRRPASKTRPPTIDTALGYASGSGAQSAIVRLGLKPQISARLGRLVDRVVPPEFTIDTRERAALDALGDTDRLTARALGQRLAIADAVTFMEHLVRKLEAYGLGDLVEPGEPLGDEPTYRLRR